MTQNQPVFPAPFGWAGFATGATALLLTLILLWAGPFAPQQPASVTIGELAAEIAKSAARSVSGQPQPAAAINPRDIDDLLNIAVAVLSGAAIIFGAAAFIRHENKRAAVSGVALGMVAITIQLFAFTVMMVAGALVLAAIVYSLRGTFGDMFGDLFGA